MSNSQPNPLELAKQGDPEAIATLMNRTLQPKGITAKAILQNRCLEVSLESSSQIPEKQTSSSFVRSGLIRLKPQCIERVKIYGKQTGKDIPSWTTEFEIVAQDNPFLPLEQPSNPLITTTEPREQKSSKTTQNTSFRLASNLTNTPNSLQSPAQKKIAKSKAYEYAISGAVLGFIISLPSVWAAIQMLQLQGGGDFFMTYIIGIIVVVFISYLSGFGQGFNQFDVNCPHCSHKFILSDPGGNCPACGTGLYIDTDGDCRVKMDK